MQERLYLNKLPSILILWFHKWNQNNNGLPQGKDIYKETTSFLLLIVHQRKTEMISGIGNPREK